MSLGLKKRVSRTIPFGYKVNEEDDKLLEPIQEELEAIEQANQYIKSCSYREELASLWIVPWPLCASSVARLCAPCLQGPSARAAAL